MRCAYITFSILSSVALAACDPPTDLPRGAEKIDARVSCPDANEIKADIDALDAADRSARAAMVQRIQEKFSAVRRVGYDRQDAGGVIVLKPTCGGNRYPDIRLVSPSELFLLLGE